ncbi:MAG: helix-turn-helix domain-containing protein [Hyphomicrobiaceae bacterium]
MDQDNHSPPVPMAYRIADASRVCGLGRTKIYELIGNGQLKAIRVGGRRLIPADSLRALLATADE